MTDVVRRAAERALHPQVEHVEHQRRIDRDRRMQTARRLPCPVADACYIFTFHAGWMQGQFATIARDRVPRIGHALDFHLQPLDRRIHIAGRAADGALLAEHVPGLDRLAKFDVDIGVRELADARKAELEVGREPLEIELIAARAQLCRSRRGNRSPQNAAA